MEITVFCASNEGTDPSFMEDAYALGAWIARQGHTLVYGGCRTGLMGAVADGALDAGGKVVGVLTDILRIQERRHPGLTEYIETATLAERKAILMERPQAFITLPGGLGTLDELGDVLSLIRAGVETRPCVVYDAGGYYQHLRAFFQEMLDAGFVEQEVFDKVLVTSDLKVIEDFLQGR